MEIKQALLTRNEYSRPGKPLIGVRGIVIHYVGNPGSSAMANRNYWEMLKDGIEENGQARYASAHFVVGLEGEIIQALPENEVGYHVGAKVYKPEALKRLSSYPNNCTIGIELCHADWSGKFNDKTLASARELAADLLARHGLTPADLWRHYDITGKMCPVYFVKHPDEWEAFKASIVRTSVKTAEELAEEALADDSSVDGSKE
jgi:N-acetylmuramoyl-L-alanine amidase